MKTESKNAKSLHLSRKFSYYRMRKYHQKFIDNSTGRFFNKYTVQRVCPVCDSNDLQKMFEKLWWNICKV